MYGPSETAPRFVLRGEAGEGYIRALVAVRGRFGAVQLEVMHATTPGEALHFCTEKAAKRFAVAVAAHYPYTAQGRYKALQVPR